MEGLLRGRQLRLLFARLASADGGAVSREELVRALWPEQPPRDAGAIVRTLLSRLRGVLGADALVGRAEVRLALPAPVQVDVRAAERALAKAQTALEGRDFLTAFACAQSALEVLRAEVMPGESAEWLERWRRQLQEARLEALECEVVAGSRLGGAARASAVRAGRELIERAPFRESGYRALMQAHEAGGNEAEAIRVYLSLRDLLRAELGVAPGDQIVALYERLLAGRREDRGEWTAYEGPPALLRRALDALQQAGPGDPALRCEMLLELGSSLAHGRESEPAREAFAQAAEIARALGRGDLLGRAVLGQGGYGIPFAPGGADEPLVTLLEEGITALKQAQTPLRVQLLARLAAALSGTPDLRRRIAVAEEALALARTLGEPSCVALALSARHLAAWGPDSLDQRRADAAELIGLSAAGAGPEAVLPGHLWLFTDLVEAGDMEGADRALEAYGRLAAELGHPGYQWWDALLRAMRHFMAGRFADAERSAERVLGLAPRAQDEVVAQLITVQVLAVRKEAGELASLEAAVREAMKRYPPIQAWRCLLAYVYAETGQPERAREEFEPLVARLDELPRDHLWLIAIALLADAGAIIGDPAPAATLYRTLLPYRGRIVVGLGGLYFGPADHHLALLARTTGDFTAAERHFQDAVATSRAMGARPWLGHTLREWAAAVAMRQLPGDREQGEALLEEATAIADELEMIDLHDAIERVHAMLAPQPTGH